MKKTLLIGLMAVGFLQSKAQTYTAVYGTGITDYDLSSTLGSGTKILDKTNNDILTATQTIPFNFNFYGTNVTQFKASDNGYITFNTSATASTPTNSNLPASAEPNNSIYAFWNDWELKAAPNPAFITAIITRTTGVAPNRKFWIQWFGVSPKGKTIAANADVLAYGIVMYENGNGLFEVYFNGGYGAASNTGVIGLENSDGSSGIHYGSGTAQAQPFVSTTSPASYPKVSFYPSTMPDNDISMLSVDFPGTIPASVAQTVKGSLINYGKTDITSLVLNYSIDGGTPFTTTLNSLSIPKAGGTYSFSHPTTITESTVGKFRNLKVWISSINSGTDANHTNDSGTAVYVVPGGTTAPRKVMIEEATGAWCQHCPDAHTYIEQIQKDYPGQVVVAVHHNADAMTNAESDVINSTYAQGYPNGYIDRTLYSGQSTVGLSRGTWNGIVGSEISAYTPVKVNMKNVNFNPTSRLITFDVEAEFTDYFAGDVRIGGMIKEAYMRGPAGGSPDYDQVISSVYTSSPTHIYYGYTSPMGGYYHKNVVINIPSGAWGSVGSIPNTAKPEDKFSKTFTYTLPTLTNVAIPTSAQFYPKGVTVFGRNKPQEIWLVGFVAKGNSSINSREILNANERQMWDITNSTSKVTASTTAVNAFPNPTSNSALVEFELPTSQKVTLKVTNALGQVVSEQIVDQMAAGLQNLTVHTENLPNGIYNVSVVAPSVTGSCKLMVAH